MKQLLAAAAILFATAAHAAPVCIEEMCIDTTSFVFDGHKLFFTGSISEVPTVNLLDCDAKTATSQAASDSQSVTSPFDDGSVGDVLCQLARERGA